MICVGIDVAKDKHDCCILDSEGTTLADCFTIPNNLDGFKRLLQTIKDCTQKSDKIKVGLEATGHYSCNILGFLLDNDLPVYVMNPLHTNLYRKSLSLRKTKTDRVDAKTIATMLLSDVDLKSYTDTAYHNEELKSLTRYRFDKVQERAKLKQSVSRLVTILFPELEQLVSSIHGTSIYALLSEYPGAKQISEAHLTRLANILVTTSRGHYRKDRATHIRDAARTSIGSVMPAKSLELKHTIKLIQELTSEINEIEDAIRKIMDELKPPILSIPGMGFYSAAMILAEVGDFSNFNSPDKVLAYAGCSPSTYQSGKLTNCYAHMEKRGSRYLRYALYTATKYVCYAHFNVKACRQWTFFQFFLQFLSCTFCDFHKRNSRIMTSQILRLRCSPYTSKRSMVCQIRMPDCDHAQNSGTFCLTCKRKAVLICQNDLSGKFCHSRSLLLLAAASGCADPVENQFSFQIFRCSTIHIRSQRHDCFRRIPLDPYGCFSRKASIYLINFPLYRDSQFFHSFCDSFCRFLSILRTCIAVQVTETLYILHDSGCF